MGPALANPRPYRGANANMHMVEAYLAAADAGADPVWRQRALRITERIVHRVARGAGWLLPEHTTGLDAARSSTGTGRRTSSARTG